VARRSLGSGLFDLGGRSIEAIGNADRQLGQMADAEK